MKLRADEHGRLTSAELFPPNCWFDAEKQPDGSVHLSRLDSNNIPVIAPVNTPEGYLILPVKLSRALISAAIRADRDAQ